MRQCAKCLNDKTVRKIKFDECGVCNYCCNFERIREKLEDSRRLEKLFRERIAAVRGKYKYDAVLGISGGKDSVYVLHQLVNKYKLKIKTFTMDNGFLTDSARENVDRMVREFKVEHEYVEFDAELLKKIYHYSMKKYLVPCVACAYVGYAAMINYAVRNNAGMCIHGRSPEQMLRGYGEDVFTSFIDLGLKSVKEIDVNEEYGWILAGISEKMDKEVAGYIEEILFDGVSKKEFREFVPYFLYHEYDEVRIVEFLKKETGWRPPEEYNHYDCAVHNAAKYIYQKAEGRPHRLPETSVLVRSGEMKKERAGEILEKELISEKPEEELKYLCEYAGVSEKEILLKAKLYNLYKKL